MMPTSSENCRRKGDGPLLVALAAGQTIADAARAAGVSERTARTRLGDEGFRLRVQELRAEMMQQAMGRISDTLTEAVETLRKLLKSKSDSVKLGAARALLEYGLRFRETIDMEERLAQVEASLAAEEKVGAAA